MRDQILRQYQDDIRAVEEFVAAFAYNLNTVPADGGWSAAQCLAHLADAEISLSLRVRMMLTSDNYAFTSWDEDAFADLKADRDAHTSVEVFKSLRMSNLELLSGLTDGQLARTGIKPNGDVVTVINYVSLMSDHCRGHLQQAADAAK